MQYPKFSQPDFLIVGMNDPESGGVWVIASDSLFQVSLEVSFETVEDGYPFERLVPIGQTYSIDTKMNNMVWVWGETYAAAMAHLMAQWAPKPSTRPELESRKEIEQW